MAAVTLKAASRDDMPILWKMQIEAFSALLQKYRDYDTSPGAESFEKVMVKFELPGSDYYFIADGDKIVGGIRIADGKDGVGKRISPIWIMPEHRNKGYAQAAISAAERLCGRVRWSLDTILQEEGNLHLYEKMGYRRTGRIERINERMDIVFLEKDVTGLKLVEPSAEYSERIREYRNAFMESGDSMDGTGALIRFEEPMDWIEHTNRCNDPLTVPEGRVPATQYMLVRASDGKIVGMLQIRHYFNAYLEKYGGHIGYSVAPDERRRGYATLMLRMALPKCRELGIRRVLITCLINNEGSRRTILNNGGVYESTVHEPNEDVELERYWIESDR